MGIFCKGVSASSAVLLRENIHEHQVPSGNRNDDEVQLLQDEISYRPALSS